MEEAQQILLCFFQLELPLRNYIYIELMYGIQFNSSNISL